MLIFVKGDIFESRCEALVNPVNTVGAAGKGLAKEFAKRFPYAHRAYQRLCRHDEIDIGVCRGCVDKNRWIIFFPTKRHWSKPSQYEYIDDGLRTLRFWLDTGVIKSIAIPALGCGNGGLDWEAVKPLIIGHLGTLENINVMVYEPHD